MGNARHTIGILILATLLPACGPMGTHDTASRSLNGGSPTGGSNPTTQMGKQLYVSQCASCHDSGIAKFIDNRSIVQIQGALSSVASMTSIKLDMAQIHSLEVYLDKVAPAPTISAPINGATLASVANVSGTCEPGLNVDVAINGVSRANVACNGSYSYVPAALASGAHTFTVKQTDLNANAASVSASVTIDNTAPAVSFLAPLASATITSPALTVSGDCEISGRNVTISGSAVAAPISAACTAAKFSASVTVIGPNGAKNLIIEQSDTAGNVGSASRSISVNFPTSAPAVTIAMPVADLQTRTGITLSGTCTAGLNVAISGTGVASNTSTACTSGAFSSAIAFSAGQGQKNVIVSQTNTLGQMGQDARNFIFDSVAPLITIASPAAGTKSGTGVTLTGACETGLNLTIAGSGVSASQTIACFGSYQIAVLFSSGLGMKTATLSQTDAAGNAASLSRNFERIDPTSDLYRAGAFGKQGLRRLTRYKLVNSLTQALTLDPTSKLGSIPGDLGVTTYFENEQGAQAISSSVIEAYRTFANSYAVDVAASATRVNALAGCTPVNASDRACFVSFAQKVGRRLLRRAVSSTEAAHIADVVLPYATADNRFATAVELLLRAWLQHPEFLYRIESGTLSNGQIALDDYQIATRMSYLIWGSSPDDSLLDAAAAGQLRTETSRVAQAQRLLGDARARKHLTRFHAEWLGYNQLQLHPSLDSDMRQETSKLIERVTFDLNQDWMTLFNSNETYVTPALAAHYSMPAMSSSGWVN